MMLQRSRVFQHYGKSLRVFALGQRLRHFVDHVSTAAGAANGARVRRWFQDKKAGWYTVLADPQMPGDQHAPGSGAQCHRAETVCHARLRAIRWPKESPRSQASRKTAVL